MHVTNLLAANNAAADWVLGAAASVVFVALVAVPALALNARDRKRRRSEGTQS